MRLASLYAAPGVGTAALHALIVPVLLLAHVGALAEEPSPRDARKPTSITILQQPQGTLSCATESYRR